MRRSIPLSLLLLLVACEGDGFAFGCGPGPAPWEDGPASRTPEGGEGDDDDAVEDDDDAWDDDDLTSEGGDGVTFDWTWEVTRVGGDDDDSAGDDDDSAGGGEVAYFVDGELVVTYWVDIQNGIANCDQHLAFEGGLWFGFGVLAALEAPGTCENCTGFFEVETFQDVSDPNLDPDHCNSGDLQAVGADYGTRMLATADPNAVPPNYGDFSYMALMDRATHAAVGADFADSPKTDWTAAGQDAEWEEFALRYWGTAFTHAHPTSLSGSAGLDQITNPPEPGSDYLAAFQVFFNPTENGRPQPDVTNEVRDMEGTYGASAGFILTLGGGW